MSQRPTKERFVPMRVRATQLGYYNLERKRPGDVFVLEKPEHFSRKWMREVRPDTPLRTTTPQQVIDRFHDENSALGKVRRVTVDDEDDNDGRAIGVDEPYV